MGQYFIIVNLEKREYIHPHDLNTGAKLPEIINDGFIENLVNFLLSDKKDDNYLYIGSWINNPVILVGDSEDYLFFKQVITNFKNISKEVYSEHLRYTKLEMVMFPFL